MTIAQILNYYGDVEIAYYILASESPLSLLLAKDLKISGLFDTYTQDIL